MSDVSHPQTKTPTTDESNRDDASAFQNLPVSFTGQGIDYFLLILKSAFLILITLGLYYPWARNHRLNFHYRHTRIGPHKLAFHGTGREIAIGYAKGLLIYGTVYGSLMYAQSLADSLPLLAMIGTVLFSLILYALFPLAIWGGRAYRSSRLSYRGIRLGMDRTLFKPFVLKTFLDIALTALTFGLYLPFMRYKFQKRLVDATLWGNEAFTFQESQRESVMLSISNFFLVLFSLGLLAPAAVMRRIRFDLSKIRFQKMEIQTQLTWSDGYLVFLFPLVAGTLSLGLLFPWATVFATRRFYSKIRLVGDVDLARIIQGSREANALGETASSLLDFDAGLGV